MSSTETQSVLDGMDSNVYDEDSIADELYRITQATNDDGTVMVEIVGWSKFKDQKSDKVKVNFVTPTLDKKHEVMEWPQRDDTTYKFVRLCREVGLSLSSALQLEGSQVRADPTHWVLEASGPEPKTPITDHIKTALSIGGDALMAILIIATILSVPVGIGSLVWLLTIGGATAGLVFVASICVLALGLVITPTGDD